MIEVSTASFRLASSQSFIATGRLKLATFLQEILSIRQRCILFRARDYLFEHHPDLWWIENDTTFRGMYLGGDQTGDLDNRRFVEEHLQSHGALGACFWTAKHEIKMGDTPTVLYLLRGTPSDPTQPSWGGRFVAPFSKRPSYWHDDPDPRQRFGDYNGAHQVNRWRADYLRDWENRLRALPRRDDRPGHSESPHSRTTP